MSVSNWVSPLNSVWGLTTDGTYIYVSDTSDESGVGYGININSYDISSGTLNQSFRMTSGNPTVGSITIDNNYLYACFIDTPYGKINLLNYPTISSASITFICSEYYDNTDPDFPITYYPTPSAIVTAGGYLYASFTNGFLGRILLTNETGDYNSYDYNAGFGPSSFIPYYNSSGYNDLNGLLVNSNPRALATDGTYLYVGCFTPTAKIVKMTLAGASGDSITASSYTLNTYSYLTGLAVSGDNQYLYALSDEDYAVLKIRLSDFSVINLYDLGITYKGKLPNGLVLNGSDLYLANYGTSNTSNNGSILLYGPISITSDTSLTTFTIDSTDVMGEGTVTVPYGTTSADVYVETTNAGASITVNDGTPSTGTNFTTVTGLITGSNTVTVYVLAENGVTNSTYYAYIIVETEPPPPPPDTSLTTFTINSEDVGTTGGGTVTVSYGTTTANVYVVTTNPAASISVNEEIYYIGTNSTTVTGLTTGSNTVIVDVVVDSETTRYYAYITVNNSTSSDTSLVTFTIDGAPVNEGDNIFVSYGTTSVSVNVVTTNSAASISVDLNEGTPSTGTGSVNNTFSGLILGSNTLNVNVLAEDGITFQHYTVYIIRENAPSVPCFGENTKILCFNSEKSEEEYVLVQDIRPGTLVKTLLNNYVPVNMIGKSIIKNYANNDRIKNRLYKCRRENYPEILGEDLILTGCHSILVDHLTEEQVKKTIQEIKQVYITDRKYRLFAFLDPRSEPYEVEGEMQIYHIALDNENYYMNYGVYANGLLVETCSKRYLKEKSGMTLIE